MVPPRQILQDLVKKGLLKPLERKAEDDNIFMGNSDAYCSYHYIRGHAINSYKTLEEDILDLIAQEKYEIIENIPNPDQAINTIIVDEKICATFRRGRLKSNPHP